MYNQIILAGVLVSLLYTELTGLVCTLAVSAAAAVLCRLLSQVVILYGRRRFVMLLLLTFLLNAALARFRLLPVRLSAVGLLIPGILAREMDRQGFLDTLLSLMVTTAVLALLLMLMGYQVLR